MATGTIKKVSNDSASGYCKMPDGTLIQWGQTNVRTASSGGAYGFYGNQPFTFPIAFVGKPTVCANVNEYAAFWGGTVHQVSETGGTASLAGNTNATAKDVLWLAVGRWK